MHPTRNALLAGGLFTVVAIFLSDVRPLWLDEILQLIDTRRSSPAELIARLPRHSGGAPLGYLAQQATLRISGYSVRRARLSAMIFGAGSVIAVAVLGAEFGLEHGWLAAGIFAIFPLTLRYATEGRMYSQALFLSLMATLVFVRYLKRPAWFWAAAYCFALVASIYTQPYAAFVCVAHLLWSIACRERKAALLSAAGVAVTLLAFLPWYLWSKARWADDIAQGGLHFSASAKISLMIFRELAGAGYWGSGLLVILCAVAIAGRLVSPRMRGMLVLLIAVPMASAVASDAIFDYFIAARQFFWVLPAVAILAAAAIERHRRAAFVIGGTLAIVCVWQDIRFFTTPREDWQRAAATIAESVRQGACLVVVPPAQAPLYEFFQPELRHARCSDGKILLATTPYSSSDQRRAAIAILTSAGYRRYCEIWTGGSNIVWFRLSP